MDLGINFLDTADIYANGVNEELISQVLVENRENIVIATKFGFRVIDGAPGVDASPQWMRQAVEGSLHRLKVETIDLYYAHRVDPQVPVEDTVGAMAELVKEGKVRFLGLSECSPEDLRKAYAVHPITAVQSEYSVLTRDVEQEILPLTKELGIAFVPFAPLGRGLITNTLNMDTLTPTDFRSRIPRYSGKHRENNEKLSQGFAELAAGKHITAAQLALAWVLAQSDHIIPIPGTKKRKYLEQNAAAVDVELTEQDHKAIESLLAQYPDIGARYGSVENKFVEKK